MRLLAFDSAHGLCSAAAGDDGEVVAWRCLELGRGHAEALLPMLEEVLAARGWGFGDLDLLAVGHGPGGFTGVRVACAAGRGLALATGLPVVAVSGLEALAQAAGPGAPVLAALDARRGQVYAQPFATDGRPLAPPAALAPGDALRGLAPPIRLAGSGAALVAAAAGLEPPAGPLRFDARDVAARAFRRLAAGEAPIAGDALVPLYLRAPDARPQPALAAAGA